MAKTFHFLTGDVNFTDYGGKWYRHIGGPTYHVIELMNWEDACGRDAPEWTYNISLSEIDTSDEERLQDSLRSYGWDDSEELTDLMKVEAMHGHGARAPLFDADGNNWKKLMQEAKRESREITSTEEAHEEAMNRAVNRIGSTAREYQRGDVMSAVLRGVSEGDEAAELMLKLGVR